MSKSKTPQEEYAQRIAEIREKRAPTQKVRQQLMQQQRQVHELNQDALFSEKGDGDADCELCGGKGWLETVQNFLPISKRCKCVRIRDMAYSLERMLPGLSNPTPTIKTTPLIKHLHENLFITSSFQAFRVHFRHVAIRKPVLWRARIVGDNDLVNAWLGSAKFKGIEILDQDVAEMTLKHLDLSDIALPPELLVIRIGQKISPFRPLPQLIEETIAVRDHHNRPTWILDNPLHSLSSPNHPAYSASLYDRLGTWPTLTLKGENTGSYLPSMESLISSSPKPTFPQPLRNEKVDLEEEEEETDLEEEETEGETPEGSLGMLSSKTTTKSKSKWKRGGRK